jgi:hypothetical protein
MKSPAVAGFIYAIQSPESPRYVKLGLSSNPQARLRNLQTGSPHKLVLIWSFACKNMAETEAAFHEVFDKYRIPAGEWFDFFPIDNPEHLVAWLTLVAYKRFGDPKAVPADARKLLENVETFIGSPARFLSSQADVDQLIARQFPDLARYEDNPDQAMAYIWRSLKHD